MNLQVTNSIEELEPEWSALALAARNLFGTPEWIRAWQECLGSPNGLRLVSARDDGGRLIGVVPLVVDRRGPLRIARFAGHGVGDVLGPVVDPTVPGLARAVLDASLERFVTDWDVFFGERMPESDGWGSEWGDTVVRSESNPTIDLTEWPDWEAYLRSRSKKLRNQIRHDQRVLANEHGMIIHRVAAGDELQPALDELFRLHELRFGQESSFVPHVAFHRRFAELALDRGWLRLWTLEADGRAVASRYDFSYGNAYYAYNAGRNPTWERGSVGLVIRAHTMEVAFLEGVTDYRFLRGDEPYKQRFGPTDDQLISIVRARSWLGRRAISLGLRLSELRGARRFVRL
jgi:CelD/BcsL family acetyltransferase involved in cellulose biosynthesis